jgi:hypothetical protein|tara:strand:- start:3912 stop:4442 length:531 start_codon:yes stop_codon:yes gene_type:complete
MNKKMRLMWQRITADRRRFGLFCTLLFVGLLLWARIIVIARPPRTAVADSEIAASVEVLATSDKILVPVLLETKPRKNPFTIHRNTFPTGNASTDNNKPLYLDSTLKAEQAIVAGLTLEAIMGRVAMINGRVVQKGDIVVVQNVPDPLRLTDVSGRSVIISAGDRRYELTIASPHR